MKANAVFSGIAVNDIQTAKSFYVDILGLKLDSDEMGLHFRLPSGGMLFVYEKPDYTPATYTVLNYVVSDIDHSVDELKDKGVSFEIYPHLFEGAPEQDEKGIMRSPDPATYGPSIAWFKDPAGNTLSIIQDT